MSRGVILVRHALPEVERGVASKLWGLGERGREDCVLLAHALPEVLAGTIWASDERKAKETADVVALRRGLQVACDPRFAEVDRPQVWDRDYREVVAAYLGGVDEDGWEPRKVAVARFGAAVDRALAAEGEGDVVVVNHGIAMSIWLATMATIDLVQFWRELAFPDAWRLDIGSGELGRVYLGGMAAE